MSAVSNTAISLLGFMPAIVVQHILDIREKQLKVYDKQKHDKKDQLIKLNLPDKQMFRSVVMFADISGFTNLTENLSKIGFEGAEITAFSINRYMELLIKGIGRSGGDIFKFAGDAIIVVWPPPKNTNLEEQFLELQMLCRQAIQSALDIQSKLDNLNVFEDIKLSVKIGFGIGDISIIYVGGIFGRSEYLAAGEPLTQAFKAEHHATKGGETIISAEVYEMVKYFFDFDPTSHEGHDYGYKMVKKLKNEYKVRMKADALMIKNNINMTEFNDIKSLISQYIPAALVPYIEFDAEKWSAELRKLTVLFLNIGIELSLAKTDEGLKKIQTVISIVQKCIYLHEGSLNKLLMDDKGSTLIVVFGFPPMAHQDDPVRGCLTAFSLIRELDKVGTSCKVGVATGTVFAGVVGTSGSRREYSVLGDSVNLSARLMQLACTNKDGKKVFCCQNTAQQSSQKLSFQFYQDVKLKGKEKDVPVFEPIEREKPSSKGFFNISDIKTHNAAIDKLTKEDLKIQRRNSFDESNISPHKLHSDDPAYKPRLQLPDINKINQMKIIGHKQELKQMFDYFDDLNDSPEKKFFIMVQGAYGVGKSFFIKHFLKGINKQMEEGSCPRFKYGEFTNIFISVFGPIKKDLKMNGMRQILRQVFKAICKRREEKESLELLKTLVPKNYENELIYNDILNYVGLTEEDMISTFPQKPEPNDEAKQKEYRKSIGKMVVQLFRAYLEQQPIKLKNLGDKVILEDEEEEEEEDEEKEEKYHKKTTPFNEEDGEEEQEDEELPQSDISESDDSNQLKVVDKNYKARVPPCILIMEDMQRLDALSLYSIKQILKNFKSVCVIGCTRTSYQELPNQFKNKDVKNPPPPQEVIFQDGIIKINSVNKLIPGNIVISELKRNGNDEFKELIQSHFGFSKFITVEDYKKIHHKNDDHEEQEIKINPLDPKQLLINARNQIDKNKVTNIDEEMLKKYKDPFIFYESKQVIRKIDYTQTILNFLYVKTQGHPLQIINFVENLISQGMIKPLIGEENELIGVTQSSFKQIFETEDILQVNAPLMSVQINGPMIDRLSCLQSLVLKVASAIGDVFDVQTLQRILPFKDTINQEKLLSELQMLDNLDYIEIMEIQDNNYYYRFSHPFFRECIYQRMTYQQRRQLHKNIAEALQIIPQLDDPDETKEEKKLNFHWALTESKATTKKVNQNDEPQFSSKAKRSMIVKGIQQTLAKYNYDSNAVLKKGYVLKKNTFSIPNQLNYRVYYMVMSSLDIRLFADHEVYEQSKDNFTYSIPLKNVMQISQNHDLNDNNSNQVYEFSISCTQYMHREKEENTAKFILAFETDDEVEQWAIYFELAKAKAIYEEFVNNFGKISFPINLLSNAYDQKLILALNIKPPSNLKQKKNSEIKQKIREVIPAKFKGQFIKESKVKLAQSQINNEKNQNEEQMNIYTTVQPEEYVILKDVVMEFVSKGMLTLYAHLVTAFYEEDYKQLGQNLQFITKNFSHFGVKKKTIEQVRKTYEQ